MKKTNKFAAIGLAAGLTVGGATGLVLAVPAISGAQSTDTTTAPATGTQGETGRPDPGQHVADALAPLVSDGTLTQDQADKVIAALEAARPQGGPGMGHGGGMGLDAAATALGITADELRTELQSGKTIAQVAGDKGVDVQTVIDAMVAQLKTHLDEEVASGEHTQAEADQKLADATTRITEQVNNAMPTGGRGPGGPGGFGGHGGPDGQAPDQGTTDTTVQG
jgi:hypothetical protein